jgi:hypothetical protein
LPVIEIRYTPSGEDADHASRASSAPSWVTFLFVLLLGLMFLVGIFLIDHDYSLAGWLWLAVSALMGIAVYQAPRVQARRALAASPSARGEIVFAIDETGITTTFPTGHSFLEWRAFVKYRETTELFLFYHYAHRSTFIPKRAMSPDQVQQLRAVLSAKIGKV